MSLGPDQRDLPIAGIDVDSGGRLERETPPVAASPLAIKTIAVPRAYETSIIRR